MEKKIFKSSEFKRSVSEMIISIHIRIKSHNEEVVMSSRTQLYPIQTPVSSVQPRLPKQDITSLSGDPLQFQTFWQLFNRSIHSNTSLDEISKFLYLKTLLTGKAANLLQGLTLTSGNYNEVLTILKSCFGDPKLFFKQISNFY